MDGDSISWALARLGSDPDLWRSLSAVDTALDAVLAAQGVPCERCGVVARSFEIGTVPLLVERLAELFHNLEARDPHRAHAAREARPLDWKGCRPDPHAGARIPRGRGRLEGGAR